MNNICAGIVTYNPDITRLKENYDHISNQVDFVVVCDNGSKNISDIKKTISNPSDSIISLDENKGIAFALNKLCEYAYDHGYKWILTLDQDSVCPDNMVMMLKKHCSNDVSIVGPRIVYEGNEDYSYSSSEIVEYPEWVITSGSITNTDVWHTINGFDDLLFIDKVDTDYCIRANLAGYKLVRDNSVELIHELGNMVCKKLFGRTIYVTNHNPMRIYYQCRNAYYLSNKIDLKHPFIETMKIKIKILLYEDNKREKLSKARAGIADGRALAKKLVH